MPLAKDSNFQPFDSQKHGRIFPGKYYLGFYVGQRFKNKVKPFKWLKMNGAVASLTDNFEEASLIDFAVDEKKVLSSDLFPQTKRDRYFDIRIKGQNMGSIPNIDSKKPRFYVPSNQNPDNDFFVESKETLNTNGTAKEKVYHPVFAISDKWLLAIKNGGNMYYFKGTQKQSPVNDFTGELTTEMSEAYEFKPNDSSCPYYEVTISNCAVLK